MSATILRSTSPAAPDGGENASSQGPGELGTAALEFYSSVRTISFAAHHG